MTPTQIILGVLAVLVLLGTVITVSVVVAGDDDNNNVVPVEPTNPIDPINPVDPNNPSDNTPGAQNQTDSGNSTDVTPAAQNQTDSGNSTDSSNSTDVTPAAQNQTDSGNSTDVIPAAQNQTDSGNSTDSSNSTDVTPAAQNQTDSGNSTDVSNSTDVTPAAQNQTDVTPVSHPIAVDDTTQMAPVSSVNVAQTPSCQMSIERVKAGADDYATVLASTSSSEVYVDYSYDIGQIIMWTDYQSTSNSLQTESNSIAHWDYIADKYPGYSMWNSQTNLSDTTQGSVNDSYFVTAVNALAQTVSGIEDIFATKAIDDEGIYAFNVYALGIPQQVTIDGRIPFNSIGSTIFASIGSDGSLWGPLVEKAWAKFSGNYEMTSSGQVSEALAFLTGSPASVYATADYRAAENPNNPQEAWTLLNLGLVQEQIAGAASAASGSSATNSYGIAYGQAFTVVGTYSVEDTTTSPPTTRWLMQLRSSSSQTNYTGPWSASSDLWTDEYKSQVNYTSDSNVFYIEDTDFVYAFEEFYVSYYNPDAVQSWYLQTHEQTPADAVSTGTYYFTTTKQQYVYVDVLLWSDRQYPSGCAPLTSVIVNVKNVELDQVVQNTTYYNQAGFNTIVLNLLEPASYSINFQITWGDAEVAVRDINIRVTCDEQVQVKAIDGAQNHVKFAAADNSETATYVTPSVTTATGDETSEELQTSLRTWMTSVVAEYPLQTAEYDGDLYFTNSYVDTTYQHAALAYVSTYPNLDLQFDIVITAGAGSSIVSTGLSTCTTVSTDDADTYTCTCTVSVSQSSYNCGYLVQLANSSDIVQQEYSYSNTAWTS